MRVWGVFVLVCALLPASSAQMLLMSSDFMNMETISNVYCCDKFFRDEYRPSIPLNWARPPAATQSFVLIMDNLDRGNFVQWAVKDIPVDITSLAADSSETSMPVGSVELLNSNGFRGFSGPCPDGEEHKFRFRLFAMPRTHTQLQSSSNPVNMTSDYLVSQIEEEALYVAVLMGKFSLPVLTEREQRQQQQMLEDLANEDDDDEDDFLANLLNGMGGDDDDDDDPFSGGGLFGGDDEDEDEGPAPFPSASHKNSKHSRHVLARLGHNNSTNHTAGRSNVTQPSTNNAANSSSTGTRRPGRALPPQPMFRFTKPSEAIKSQRSRDTNSSNSQQLVQYGERIETLPSVPRDLEEDEERLWDCEKNHKHGVRYLKGETESCGMRVRVTDAACGQTIFPRQFMCLDNSKSTSTTSPSLGLSPSVMWRDAPQATKSYALVVEDSTNVGDSGDFEKVFWFVTDLPSHLTSIDANATLTAMPPLSVEHRNSFNFPGYTPPCVSGSGSHTYRVHVLAMPHTQTWLNIDKGNHDPITSKSILSQLRTTALCSSSIELQYSDALSVPTPIHHLPLRAPPVSHSSAVDDIEVIPGEMY